MATHAYPRHEDGGPTRAGLRLVQEYSRLASSVLKAGLPLATCCEEFLADAYSRFAHVLVRFDANDTDPSAITASLIAPELGLRPGNFALSLAA